MSDPASPESPTASTTYHPTHPVDVSFALLGTKTVRTRSGVHWWVTNSPLGPVSTAFRVVDGRVRADSWGPGSEWAMDRLPSLLGADDDPEGFRPHHQVVQHLAERFSNPRIGATGRWYEALATAAIGQRVVTADAGSSRARISWRYGGPAPGGAPDPLFPSPASILMIPDHAFHEVGMERARARVVRVAAKHAGRLERLEDVDGAEARRWLQRLPGVGPWTAALTTSVAGGDPDAVPVGDLHIPSMVSRALAGIEDGDDQTMLELLEPYAGHRQRVVRMLKLGGTGGPRRHPAPFRYDISGI